MAHRGRMQRNVMTRRVRLLFLLSHVTGGIARFRMRCALKGSLPNYHQLQLDLIHFTMSSSQASLAAQQKEMSRKLEEYIEK